MNSLNNLSNLLKNWKGRKVLMTVFPHPDDETVAAGGLLQIARGLGWTTIVVALTYGEAGRLFVNANGKSIREIRGSELGKAAKILSVDRVIQGDFGDAKLGKSMAEWLKWLEMVIKLYKPVLVVTYDHSGLTGHPDHIILSVGLKKLISEKFPKINLYWSALPKNLRRQISSFRSGSSGVEPTHFLDLGSYWFKKWRAIRAYKSQKLGKDYPVPLPFFLAYYHFEWYHKVDLSREYKYRYIEFKI